MDTAFARSETARSLAPTSDSVTARQASCGQLTVRQTDDTDGTDGQNGTDGEDGTSGQTLQNFLNNLSSRTILLAAGGTTLAILVLAVLLRL